MKVVYFLFLILTLLATNVLSQSKTELLLKKADDIYGTDYKAYINYCNKAEKLNDKRFYANVAIFKARYFITFTDYVNAEKEIVKAITICKSKNDFKNLGKAYNLKSILLKRLGKTTSSIYYLLKAYQLSKRNNDFRSQIHRLTNLSNEFIDQNQLSKADYYLSELDSLVPYLKKTDFYYYYQNKGSYFLKTNDIKQAISCYEKAEKVATINKMIDSKATVLKLLAETYRINKKFKVAEKYAQQSYDIAKEHHLIFEKSEALLELIQINEASGKFNIAYNLQKEFIKVEKEILDSEKLNRVSSIQNKLALTEKENIISKQNNKIALEKIKNTESELKNQKLYIFLILIGLAFILFIYNYLKTKKLNRLIKLQKQDVENKNRLVEMQHKDIKDSIRYAERIQHAILPPEARWFSILPNSFVYYAPKDILSGDFYWIEETEDFIFVAAADCTGHGVPGALISIVNYNLLNKAVLEKHIYDPAKILDAVNGWLTESLHQTFNNSTVKDGMDVSLISINKKTNELLFAGAFNPIYIFQDNQVNTIKADKFPVGTFIHEELQYFETKSYQLKKGDKIYLFTDGFADQFGGVNNKKYKYGKFKDTFNRIQNESVTSQRTEIQKEFENWKGENEQVDDVLVIGICID